MATTWDSGLITWDSFDASWDNYIVPDIFVNQFITPNFTRSRARYRGPRESYYINRSLNQLIYSFRKLYEKYDTLDTTLTIDLKTIELGGNMVSSYTRDGVTAPFVINGLNDLSLRITKLKKRVEVLEEGM